MTRRSRLDQVRALAPAFFSRFFETEITAGATDLRASIFYLIAFLAAPGAAVPLLIGLGSSPAIEGPGGWGWNMVATHQGVEALRLLALSDKTFYIGCSMAAAGLISAVVWNSLLIDRRDALVLGVLPVSAPTIVLSKLVALAGFIAMVVVGMHLLASVSFGLFLGAENTFVFVLRGMVAHFIASCAASAFVVCAVAGTQGASLALLGPRVFARVTPVLQLALVAITIVGLCLLPRLSHSAAVMMTTNAADLRALAVPPFWFVGAYESVLGTPFALMHRLSTIAFSALGSAALLTVVSYAVAYRRLMTAAVEVTPRSRLRVDLPRWAATIVSRDAEVRAIVHFFVSTLTRLERQRFVLASAIGAGLAWGLPGWIVVARGVPQQPPATILAVPFSLMLAVLVAFRMAAALPADPRASWAFDFSLASWRTTRRALERAMLMFGVAPVVLLSGAVYAYLVGHRRDTDARGRQFSPWLRARPAHAPRSARHTRRSTVDTKGGQPARDVADLSRLLPRRDRGNAIARVSPRPAPGCCVTGDGATGRLGIADSTRHAATWLGWPRRATDQHRRGRSHRATATVSRSL